jgi:DNA-binding transcriptional regulator YiaG
MTPESNDSAKGSTSAGKPFPRFCDICRKNSVWPVTTAYRTEVQYEGRRYNVDPPHLIVPRCEQCGSLYFDNAAEEQVNNALRDQLHLLMPEQIRANRMALGLTGDDLSNRLGVTPEELNDWEDGLVFQSRAVDNLLRAFFALPTVRAELRGAEQNPSFGTVVGAA